MLTSADIARMRATAERALPDTCVLYGGALTPEMYPTGGTSPTGGWVETFAAQGTVDCRIAPLSGDERERGAVISAEADWTITLPANTTIETDDRIVASGGTFDVVAVRERASWEITRRLETRKLT